MSYPGYGLPPLPDPYEEFSLWAGSPQGRNPFAPRRYHRYVEPQMIEPEFPALPPVRSIPMQEYPFDPSMLHMLSMLGLM